jgi:hypothetical protein
VQLFGASPKRLFAPQDSVENPN